MKIYEYRVVKLEHKLVMIEYKTARWADWKQIDKTFKTVTKAHEYALLHFNTSMNTQTT